MNHELPKENLVATTGTGVVDTSPLSGPTIIPTTKTAETIAATVVVADNGGLRYNKGKTRWSLFPFDALEEIGKVYTKGAEKYAPNNWLRGMDHSKCFDSMMRHIRDYHNCIDLDEETGLHHMAHVAWNAIAILTYQLRGLGVDDRVIPIVK